MRKKKRVKKVYGERAVLEEGKESCDHAWRKINERWDEIHGPESVLCEAPEWMRRLPKWHFDVIIRLCMNCGRQEVTGGLIFVPEKSEPFLEGMYQLSPKGGMGAFIA